MSSKIKLFLLCALFMVVLSAVLTPINRAYAVISSNGEITVDNFFDHVKEFSVLSSSEVVLRFHGGQEDIIFWDKNPWDTTYRYESDDDCGTSSIQFIGSNDPNGSLRFTLRYKDTSSNPVQCKTYNADSAIGSNTSLERRNYDAYYIDENIIFMPTYLERRGCFGDDSNRKHGIFQRWDAEDLGYSDDIYVLIENGSYSIPPNSEGIAKKDDGEWVDTRKSEQIRKRVCAGQAETSSRSISIAPKGTMLPTVYRDLLIADNIINQDGTTNLVDEESEVEQTGCESKGGPFGWILCGVLEGTLKALDIFANFVQERLDVSLQDEDMIRSAWGEIRTIANILFVAAFLFIIISQVVVGRF